MFVGGFVVEICSYFAVSENSCNVKEWNGCRKRKFYGRIYIV